jgi:hypothetical protein
MTYKHIAVRALSGGSYEPFHQPHHTTSKLHLDKFQTVYQPFDAYRHNNHMSWVPAPHTYRAPFGKKTTNGFWGRYGIDR